MKKKTFSIISIIILLILFIMPISREYDFYWIRVFENEISSRETSTKNEFIKETVNHGSDSYYFVYGLFGLYNDVKLRNKYNYDMEILWEGTYGINATWTTLASITDFIARYHLPKYPRPIWVKNFT